MVFDIAMKQIVPYFVSQDNDLLIMDFDIPEWARKQEQKNQGTVTVVQAAAASPMPAQEARQIKPLAAPVSATPSMLKGSDG